MTADKVRKTDGIHDRLFYRTDIRDHADIYLGKVILHILDHIDRSTQNHDITSRENADIITGGFRDHSLFLRHLQRCLILIDRDDLFYTGPSMDRLGKRASDQAQSDDADLMDSQGFSLV